MTDRPLKPAVTPIDAHPTALAPDAIVADFLARWRRGERPPIEAHLAGSAASDDGTLRLLVRADLAERLSRGEAVRLEGYLDRFPALRARDDRLRELVLEEFCLRRQHGDAPTLEEYAARFPAQVAALRVEFGLDAEAAARADAASSAPPSHQPEASARISGFPTNPQLNDRGANPESDDSAIIMTPIGSPSIKAVDAILHDAPATNTVGGDALRLFSRIPPSESAAPRPPLRELDAGTAIGDFDIVRLLGAGGIAHVYLARQRSLGRLVALKVSPDSGVEGRTLASLEHDHIVQVFAEQVVGGARLMAMRYVPGITLARLLEQLASRERHELTGQDLVACVDADVGASPAPQDATAREDVKRLDFVRACCRLILGLARALEHAHRQRVLHRDVKPGNVLLVQNGRALLMDFNIAARGEPSAAGADVFGGTPVYMAPEHLSAMALKTPAQVRCVDERSDIYSLGVVFYELLTGRHPFRAPSPEIAFPAALTQMMADRLQGPPPVPLHVLNVSAGLESILSKCLAALPADRYQNASELADDLERYLSDRPLRFAADPSWSERASKWWRRHPRVRVSIIAAGGVLAATLVYSAASDLHRLSRADTLLTEAQMSLDAGDSRAARRGLDQASQSLAAPLGVLRYFGGTQQRNRSRARANELSAAVTQATLRQFHQLADSTRAGVPTASILPAGGETVADPLEIFDVLARDDWQRGPAFLALETEQQAEIEEVVTEFLIGRAQARLLYSPPGTAPDAVRRDVIDLLHRVPPRFEHAAALAQLREHAKVYPDAGPAAPATPPNDWSTIELYLMGVREANEQRYATAVHYFAAARDRCDDNERPLKYWSHFQLADCSARLNRTDEAILEYAGCIALRSDGAWPYYNLGLIYAVQDDPTKLALALKNFDQAIRCAPTLAVAHSSRGAVLKKLKRLDEAVAACTEAIRLGLRAPEPYCNRGSAYAEMRKFDEAIRDFRMALEIDSRFEEAAKNLRLLGVTVQ